MEGDTCWQWLQNGGALFQKELFSSIDMERKIDTEDLLHCPVGMPLHNASDVFVDEINKIK